MLELYLYRIWIRYWIHIRAYAFPMLGRWHTCNSVYFFHVFCSVVLDPIYILLREGHDTFNVPYFSFGILLLSPSPLFSLFCIFRLKAILQSLKAHYLEALFRFFQRSVVGVDFFPTRGE